MMEFIAKMREGSNGKPIGFKVAARAIFYQLSPTIYRGGRYSFCGVTRTRGAQFECMPLRVLTSLCDLCFACAHSCASASRRSSLRLPRP